MRQLTCLPCCLSHVFYACQIAPAGMTEHRLGEVHSLVKIALCSGGRGWVLSDLRGR